MIEFDGYISGASERYMWKKARRFGIIITYIAMTIFLPFIVYLYFELKSTFGFGTLEIILGYFSLYLIVPLISLIPKSKKEKARFNTCKVFTDEEYIVARLGNGEEHTRLIDEVKLVNDFEEFYEIIFPFGKKSTNFICQKKLLVKGTLAEFEKLFEGKIVKKYEWYYNITY